ncbi:hypothetical protein YC2023_058970 [Brassica napus]|uniref:(rape) hypothetical protein n=1 Tax=Brassica napus TaxID=3708 RepID=A0A816KY42_BRANA|nr:unnamed protein product [Brassica napus]
MNRLVSFPEKFTYNASIIYPTEIIKAAQPSLAKAKFFKKVSENGLVAKVEKLEKELQKAKRLEPWKRVVKARRMNQGYVIKCFQ